MGLCGLYPHSVQPTSRQHVLLYDMKLGLELADDAGPHTGHGCKTASVETVSHQPVAYPTCRRLQDTVHIAQTIAATVGAETTSPFEFRVLEALLAETAHHFEGKSR